MLLFSIQTACGCIANKPFRFFYYTAGTGGAGPTIMATSFLLLGEDVIAYNKGQILGVFNLDICV